jgi:mRNA interferase MazF
MGPFIKGDVVVVPFPFSDLSNVTKRRPALVVANIDGDDVILCMITSVNRVDRYSISLADSDFQSGSINIDSNIRPNRLFTADANIIIRKKGNISADKMGRVVEQIKEIVEN